MIFKIDDEATGVNPKTVKVEVEGQSYEVEYGRDGFASVQFSPYRKNKPLADGRKTIKVTASDWFGNLSTSEYGLTIDNALSPLVRATTTNAGSRPGGTGGGRPWRRRRRNVAGRGLLGQGESSVLAAPFSAELPFVRRESLLSRISRLSDVTDWAHFFQNAPELSPADRARLRGADPELAMNALELGARIFEKSNLPERTSQLVGGPSALFSFGDADCLKAPSVAIVGTRGASTYGKAAARKFAEALSSNGVTIVSGGAQGIDAAAHEGALDAGGKTACVMACGIDKVYPAAHRSLFGESRKADASLASFPPDGILARTASCRETRRSRRSAMRSLWSKRPKVREL